METKTELLDQAVTQLEAVRETFAKLEEVNNNPNDEQLFENAGGSMQVMIFALELMHKMEVRKQNAGTD